MNRAVGCAALLGALGCAAPPQSSIGFSGSSAFGGLPASVSASMKAGGAPADVPLQIVNRSAAGGCALAWTATAPDGGAGFLQLVSAQGTGTAASGTLAAGAQAALALHFAAAALVPGTYVGTLVVAGVCPDNGRPALGSPKIIPVDLTVSPQGATLTVRWRIGGLDAANACPQGATVELRGLSRGAVTTVPCSDGQHVVAGDALGARTLLARLLSAGGATLDLLDAPALLVPGGAQSLDLDFLASGTETDGSLRPLNSPACLTDTNLLVNDGFEAVPSPAVVGRWVTPLAWDAVAGTPGTFSAEGSYGLPLNYSGDFTGVTPLQGLRFVAAQSFDPGIRGQQAISQALSAPLTPDHEYRLRAFLHPANSTSSAPGAGGYLALLTNDDRSQRVYLGRFVPNANPQWESRSFAFRVPASAGKLTRLELAAFSHDYTVSALMGLDGISLSEVTGCARPTLQLAWTVAGAAPAQTCPPQAMVRVRVQTNPEQVALFRCTAGQGTLADLTSGATLALVDLLDADGTTLLDSQELLADLRASNTIPASIANVDLLALGAHVDGTPAVNSAPACGGATELLRNGGFESSATTQSGTGLLPAEWVPLGNLVANTWSVDTAYGIFPGTNAEDDYQGSLPAEGARFLDVVNGQEYVAQALTAPLTPGHSYRVRALLRNAELTAYRHGAGGYEFALASDLDATTGNPAAGQQIGTLLPAATGAPGTRWQLRSFVFQARTGADALKYLALRPVSLASTDGTDLAPPPSAPAIDALSLTDVTACVGGGTVRVTWSIASVASPAGCQPGDSINVSLDGAPRIAVPCAQALIQLPANNASPHVYAELVRAGAVAAALETSVSVGPGGVARADFAFLRSVTGKDGMPCLAESNACFGVPQNLFVNGSFEELPAGIDINTDYLTNPTGWLSLGNVYTYHQDALLGGAAEDTAPIHAFSRILPQHGVRFRSAFGSSTIDSFSGEGGDRLIQPVPIVAGHKYRLRAWVRRGSPLVSLTGSGATFRIRLGIDTDPFPSPDPPKRNLRVDAAALCPVQGTAWESRSVTFIAPTNGPYLYFDAFNDTSERLVGIDDVSLTEVTSAMDCAP